MALKVSVQARIGTEDIEYDRLLSNGVTSRRRSLRCGHPPASMKSIRQMPIYTLAECIYIKCTVPVGTKKITECKLNGIGIFAEIPHYYCR